MRVLWARSLGGSGQLTGVNVARALGRLGHDAVVLIPPSLVTEIEREGPPYEVGGEPPRAVIDERWERVRSGPAGAVAGLIDREPRTSSPGSTCPLVCECEGVEPSGRRGS
jgi:hypothetical protein